MRYFVLALLAIGLTTAASPETPNVLFVLVDDWGCADAGVLGSDYLETPNIDRFARQSLRFTNAYSASPVCSPTRAAIMTGKSPARLDMTIWHEGAVAGGPQDRRLLEAVAQPNLAREEFTLAELFKSRGYFTAHIGKWHLGTAAYYPETQGYDVNIGGTYWGAPASFFYPYRGVWSESDQDLRYVPIGPGREGDYLTDRLTDHAADQIRQSGDQPFFVSLWLHTVHTPIQGKPDLVEHFRNKPGGRHHRHPEYAAMVASLDQNFGRLLDDLDRAGLTDDTIVVLTSDNGGVDFPTSKSGSRPPTENTPHRAGKGTLYEGGIRVPLMIRWPGVTRSGTCCDHPVISEDFLPTFAEALEATSTSEQRLDGESMLSLLHHPTEPRPRRTLYWHYPHYYPRMSPGSAIRDGNWKLIHWYEDDRIELYDLAVDPAEQTNLADEQAAVADRLFDRLQAWRENVGANEPRANPAWQD